MFHLTFDSDEELVLWINRYVKTHPEPDKGIEFLNRVMNNKDFHPPYSIGFIEDKGMFFRDKSNKRRWYSNWSESAILTYFYNVVKDE